MSQAYVDMLLCGRCGNAVEACWSKINNQGAWDMLRLEPPLWWLLSVMMELDGGVSVVSALVDLYLLIFQVFRIKFEDICQQKCQIIIVQLTKWRKDLLKLSWMSEIAQKWFHCEFLERNAPTPGVKLMAIWWNRLLAIQEGGWRFGAQQLLCEGLVDKMCDSVWERWLWNGRYLI